MRDNRRKPFCDSYKLLVILLVTVAGIFIVFDPLGSAQREDTGSDKKFHVRVEGQLNTLASDRPLVERNVPDTRPERVAQPASTEKQGYNPLSGSEVSAAESAVPVVNHIEKTQLSTDLNPGVTRKKVAYAITVTKDGPFVDGALVLGYAAKKYHDAKKGYPSPYDVDLVAFVVPSVVSSRKILERYGWRIVERKVPVSLDEIENQDYADRMRDSGCCGADEFLKLWAYTLVEYHRVIHLDMDSIIFQNMDELYAIDKEILYTGDYNMKAGSPVAPAQGGFLVIRPSMETFEEFRSIIRKGDHRSGSGWGGSHIGNFWGGQTIQGIIPYYYHKVRPGRGIELNRCVYNCMVDNPYRANTLKCLDGKQTCQDCRQQTPELVSSAHFTICQKPWTCTLHTNPRNMVLCLELHKKWFALRDELEHDWQLDMSYRAENTRFKDSLGMCAGYGDKKYLPIPISATN